MGASLARVLVMKCLRFARLPPPSDLVKASLQANKVSGPCANKRPTTSSNARNDARSRPRGPSARNGARCVGAQFVAKNYSKGALGWGRGGLRGQSAHKPTIAVAKALATAQLKNNSVGFASLVGVRHPNHHQVSVGNCTPK